ncbi:MAG: hypothetical protein R3F43_00065 [bacterium]
MISRIGRGGVERVAGYLRNREAAAFVAEHGEAAVYALDEAQGNVAAARTRLPARQLGAARRGRTGGGPRGSERCADSIA